ncbi:hypothetical protein JHK84_043254 [Glycine max]|nr:hypothetical protein JHK86_043065 [Glycine max]KAG5117141.1 hypothetical protein JHK84_043254 [Glycine max]
MPLGTARGLEYLHGQCNPRIIDRDVKATNILLDGDFEAVAGDFGDCNGLQAIGMSFSGIRGASGMSQGTCARVTIGQLRLSEGEAKMRLFSHVLVASLSRLRGNLCCQEGWSTNERHIHHYVSQEEALSSHEGLQIYDYRLPFKSISRGSIVS